MISGNLCPLQTCLWTLQLPPLHHLGPVKYSHPAALMVVKTLNQKIFIHFMAMASPPKDSHNKSPQPLQRHRCGRSNCLIFFSLGLQKPPSQLCQCWWNL